MILKLINIFLSFPRTIYFNLRYLPLSQALKLPIWIANNVRIRNMYRGGITLQSGASLGLIRIGYHKVDAIDIYSLHTVIDIHDGGKWILDSDAHIGHGAILCVKNGGTLKCGENFAISGTTSIVCSDNITIGNNVQFSWDTLVMDSDAHFILDKDGSETNNTRPITIGNKVWIAAKTTILKGTTIGDNCVVGAASVLNKEYIGDNSIIAGSPARIIKEIGGWHL